MSWKTSLFLYLYFRKNIRKNTSLPRLILQFLSFCPSTKRPESYSEHILRIISSFFRRHAVILVILKNREFAADKKINLENRTSNSRSYENEERKGITRHLEAGESLGPRRPRELGPTLQIWLRTVGLLKRTNMRTYWQTDSFLIPEWSRWWKSYSGEDFDGGQCNNVKTAASHLRFFTKASSQTVLEIFVSTNDLWSPKIKSSPSPVPAS